MIKRSSIKLGNWKIAYPFSISSRNVCIIIKKECSLLKKITLLWMLACLLAKLLSVTIKNYSFFLLLNFNNNPPLRNNFPLVKINEATTTITKEQKKRNSTKVLFYYNNLNIQSSFYTGSLTKETKEE